jgi:hypothetical protein
MTVDKAYCKAGRRADNQQAVNFKSEAHSLIILAFKSLNSTKNRLQSIANPSKNKNDTKIYLV